MSTFENQCNDINEILMEKNLFLRVYKKRNKFCYLIRKPTTGQNSVIRNLSLCVVERYNGYQVVKIENRDCQKALFEPIDIVYDPVERPDQNIECYYTFKIYFPYRYKYFKGAAGIDTLHAFQCYACSKFHSTKKIFEKHLSVCSQRAGIV